MGTLFKLLFLDATVKCLSQLLEGEHLLLLRGARYFMQSYLQCLDASSSEFSSCRPKIIAASLPVGNRIFLSVSVEQQLQIRYCQNSTYFYKLLPKLLQHDFLP